MSQKNALNNQTIKTHLTKLPRTFKYLKKLVNQVITLVESKKRSEQPNYQEPSDQTTVIRIQTVAKHYSFWIYSKSS